MELSLAWLLRPLTVQTFLDEIWAATHYYFERGCADYFKGLVGPTAVEEVLEFSQSEPASVLLIRGRDIKDPDSYRRSDGTVDLVRVRNGFAEGYTIILNNLERYVDPIASLSHAIEVELNFETQINAYVTPPHSQGLTTHYDNHDVLVLQIQGCKTWHLYPDADVPPHKMGRGLFVASGLRPRTDVCLPAGDVLYVPRGRVHEAESHVEPSIHLTVGIFAPTMLTLITRALESLSYRDDRVMARLPPRHLDDVGVRAGLSVLVRDILGALDDPSLISEGLGEMGDVLVRRGRCRPVGQMVANAVEVPRIDGQTLLVKNQPLYSRVVSTADGVALQFADALLTASADHTAALLFLSTSTEPIKVCDLPGLSADQQMELARALIVDGFLVRLPD